MIFPFFFSLSYFFCIQFISNWLHRKGEERAGHARVDLFSSPKVGGGGSRTCLIASMADPTSFPFPSFFSPLVKFGSTVTRFCLLQSGWIDYVSLQPTKGSDPPTLSSCCTTTATTTTHKKKAN
jgi:hypothetical protein